MPNRSLIATVVVLTSCLGAFLWAEWQSSQPVGDEAIEDLVGRGQMNLEAMQRDLEADIAARPKSVQQERLDSPLGQALFRKCSDWIEFYDNQPGEEARGHRDEACAEYRDYVDNGTLPAGRPDSS